MPVTLIPPIALIVINALMSDSNTLFKILKILNPTLEYFRQVSGGTLTTICSVAIPTSFDAITIVTTKFAFVYIKTWIKGRALICLLKNTTHQLKIN